MIGRSRENAGGDRESDDWSNAAFLAYYTDSFDQVVRDCVRDSILEMCCNLWTEV